jgi:lysozyme family protein
MKDNWPECIAFTLSFEGGYDANPKDRGNWTSGVIGQGRLVGTKYGIAAHVYPSVDIANLTKQQAILIYRTDYWPKVAGDHQPAGVDLIAWDICVNSGASRALKIQAQALGSTAKSATALSAAAERSSDKVAIVKAMCSIRASFYRSLSTFNTFGKGWLRRNAAAEAKGVTMALRAKGGSAADIKKRLDAEGGKAGNAANTSAAGSAGSGAATAGPTQLDSAWGFDFATLGKVAIVLALIGFAIYLGRKFVQHNERKKAYAAASAGIIGG